MPNLDRLVAYCSWEMWRILKGFWKEGFLVSRHFQCELSKLPCKCQIKCANDSGSYMCLALMTNSFFTCSILLSSPLVCFLTFSFENVSSLVFFFLLYFFFHWEFFSSNVFHVLSFFLLWTYFWFWLRCCCNCTQTLKTTKMMNFFCSFVVIATLALGSRSRQGVARLHAKKKTQE